MPTKLKRLPYNSYTIVLKFETDDERDECIQSEAFLKAYGKLLSKIGITYNCKIEPITN